MGRLVFIVAGLLLALALVGPTNVSAHADYDHSTPGDGEVVAVAPTIVHVYFTEDVAAGPNSFLNVVNSSNVDVDLNDSGVDGGDHTHMTIGLQAGLPDGVYTVEWQSQAEEDGDIEEGEFTFTVGSPVGGLSTEAVGGGPDSGVIISAVSIAIIALMAFGGGAWFVRRHA